MVNYTEFERVFNHCDVDGDGKISPQELQHGVKLVCGDISQEEIRDIVSSLDSDGDGLLGLEDFVGLIKGKGGDEETIKDLREAFGVYTMDEGEGIITPQSLHKTLGLLGEFTTVDECRMAIHQFDLNGDGVLNFDEFKAMMMQ